MAKTSVPCPNCRQPVLIDLTRLFDVNSAARQKMLYFPEVPYFSMPQLPLSRGLSNSTRLYDPVKQLLLTTFLLTEHLDHRAEKTIGLY